MSPEDLASLTEALVDAVNDARAQDGCISYAFSVDIEDAGIMRVNEVWRDMDAITLHTSKPHFSKLGAALSQVKILEQSINLYPATEVIPFGGQNIYFPRIL